MSADEVCGTLGRDLGEISSVRASMSMAGPWATRRGMASDQLIEHGMQENDNPQAAGPAVGGAVGV